MQNLLANAVLVTLVLAVLHVAHVTSVGHAWR